MRKLLTVLTIMCILSSCSIVQNLGHNCRVQGTATPAYTITACLTCDSLNQTTLTFLRKHGLNLPAPVIK